MPANRTNPVRGELGPTRGYWSQNPVAFGPCRFDPRLRHWMVEPNPGDKTTPTPALPKIHRRSQRRPCRRRPIHLTPGRGDRQDSSAPAASTLAPIGQHPDRSQPKPTRRILDAQHPRAMRPAQAAPPQGSFRNTGPAERPGGEGCRFGFRLNGQSISRGACLFVACDHHGWGVALVDAGRP